MAINTKYNLPKALGDEFRKHTEFLEGGDNISTTGKGLYTSTTGKGVHIETQRK